MMMMDDDNINKNNNNICPQKSDSSVKVSDIFNNHTAQIIDMEISKYVYSIYPDIKWEITEVQKMI